MWISSRIVQTLGGCTRRCTTCSRRISTRAPLKLEQRLAAVDPLTQINNVLSLNYGSEMATHKFNKILKDASESNEDSRSTNTLFWILIERYFIGLGNEITDVEQKAQELFNELCEKNTDEFNAVQYLLNKCDIGMKRRKKIKEDLICSSLNFYLYQRFSFKEAHKCFSQQMQLYRSAIGLHSMLEYALRSYAQDTAHIISSTTSDDLVTKSTQKILRDRINELQEKCRVHMPTGEFMAHLVVSMIVTGQVKDAKVFTRAFSIDGGLFISSLRKLAEEDDITSIESFAEILETAYYPEQRATNTKKKKEKVELKKDNPLDCKLSFLYRIWKPYKAQSLVNWDTPPKFHKINAFSMQKLLVSFVQIWLQKAEQLDDLESLDKFCAFVQKNEIKLGKRGKWICKRAYERNQQICPLPLDDLDATLKI